MQRKNEARLWKKNGQRRRGHQKQLKNEADEDPIPTVCAFTQETTDLMELAFTARQLHIVNWKCSTPLHIQPIIS